MLHRPRALIAIVAILVVSALPGSVAQGAPAGGDLAQRFLAELNAERAARGVAPLRWDGAIAVDSAGWAAQMTSMNALRHSGNGRGEIIGQGRRTGQITQLWMRSGPHRNLLVDPNFVAAGIGVNCDASGRMWAVVQFRQGNPSVPVLRNSPSSPAVTSGDSGGSCSVGGEVEPALRRLYLAYFQRQADGAGLAYWVSQASAGVPLRSISENFAHSPEFRSRYGTPSDGEFVRLVYRNVLRREPDGAGLEHWVRTVAAKGRGEVMLGFAQSPEFRAISGYR